MHLIMLWSQIHHCSRSLCLQLIDIDGNPLALKGVNYFGFNNGATMFDGLYAGSDSLEMDFGLNLYRFQARFLALCGATTTTLNQATTTSERCLTVQALGFNAIRVPFSFQNLFNLQPNSFTKTCTAASQAEIRQNLTPPNTNVPASVQLPVQVTFGLARFTRNQACLVLRSTGKNLNEYMCRYSLRAMTPPSAIRTFQMTASTTASSISSRYQKRALRSHETQSQGC